MDVNIRSISFEEIQDFLDNVESAFGHRFAAEGLDSANEVIEPERSNVAEVGGSIVGTTGAFSFDLSVPGGELPAAGVTMVGVLPTHRRRGVLTKLMRHQLDDVASRGESLAVLWASEGQIYARFGYGLASLSVRIDILRERTGFLTPMPKDVTYRLVETDDGIKAMSDVYERVRAHTPGFYARSEAWWRHHRLRDPEPERDGGGPMFKVIVEIGGEARAYALYRMHARWVDGSPGGYLNVIEAVADGSDATRAMWEYLFGIDLVTRIECRGLPADLPLIWMLQEPRRLRAMMSDGLWLRIVDLPRALAARAYPADGSVVIEVVDDIIKANHGRWKLTSGEGRGTAHRTEDDADLSMTIADLGAVYLGGCRMTALVEAGRVGEHRLGAAQKTDAMFAWHRAPWCPELF